MSQMTKMPCGVLAMVGAALVSTMELVLCMVIGKLGFPFFRIMAGAALLTSLVFAAIGTAQRLPFPSMAQAKWILLRAAIGTLCFVSNVLSVQAGASPGDVAALTSINMIGAALMGHLFLKEHLRFVHGCALVFSVGGAVLICKPSFVFGSAVSHEGSGLGYVFALCSGILMAGSFICARKSAETPVSFLAFCTAASAVPVLLLLPCTPLVVEAPASVLAASPWLTAGFVAVAFACALAGIALTIAGSVMCPAAVSATVNTGSGMVFGYAAQALLFDVALGPLTVAGAALMLSAVGLMAAARLPQPAESAGEARNTTPEAAEASSASVEADVGTETEHPREAENESLASFAASEFAKHHGYEAVRLRRTTSTAPVPHRLGAAAAAVAVVAV